jgi:TonB family protein
MIGDIFDWHNSGPKVTLTFPSRNLVQKKGTGIGLKEQLPAPLFSPKTNPRIAVRSEVNVSKNEFQKTVRQFQKLQSDIDRRIDQFKMTFARWFEQALTSKGEYSDYLSRMRQRIASAWSRFIPSIQGDSGTVTVEYRILEKGGISDLKTVSVSGSGLFSRSCIQAVQQASPFDPLPLDLVSGAGGRSLTVRLTFYLKESRRGELETSEVRRLIKIRLVRP